jgi:hypothetical protein
MERLKRAVTREELEHLAMLAITTIGWPAAHASITWIDDDVPCGDAE